MQLGEEQQLGLNFEFRCVWPVWTATCKTLFPFTRNPILVFQNMINWEFENRHSTPEPGSILECLRTGLNFSMSTHHLLTNSLRDVLVHWWKKPSHGLRTPREEIVFTTRPKIESHSQRYGRSIFSARFQTSNLEEGLELTDSTHVHWPFRYWRTTELHVLHRILYKKIAGTSRKPPQISLPGPVSN